MGPSLAKTSMHLLDSQKQCLIRTWESCEILPSFLAIDLLTIIYNAMQRCSLSLKNLLGSLCIVSINDDKFVPISTIKLEIHGLIGQVNLLGILMWFRLRQYWPLLLSHFLYQVGEVHNLKSPSIYFQIDMIENQFMASIPG